MPPRHERSEPSSLPHCLYSQHNNIYTSLEKGVSAKYMSKVEQCTRQYLSDHKYRTIKRVSVSISHIHACTLGYKN